MMILKEEVKTITTMLMMHVMMSFRAQLGCLLCSHLLLHFGVAVTSLGVIAIVKVYVCPNFALAYIYFVIGIYAPTCLDKWICNMHCMCFVLKYSFLLMCNVACI